MSAVAERFFQVPPYVLVGSASRPMAYRREVSGSADAPNLVFRSLEKAAP
jgi:hypothetical protein